MTWTIQDHAHAVLNVLSTAGVTVHDGEVADGAPAPYVLVYLYVQTPDGQVAPDKVALSGGSTVVDMWIYCHCVGLTAAAARGVSGAVSSALLDKVVTISGRTCFPIRWREGQPPVRNEDTGEAIFDQVDVYGLTSVPG